MPVVSVIVPVCNAETYLRQCLDSVLGQTLRDIEVICVNDGSTDGSAAILAEYAANDPRLTVLAQANAGSGAARNRGIDASRGRYVAFMDADDVYPDENVLRDLAGAAEREGVMACGGSLEELLPNGAVRTSFSGVGAALLFAKDGLVYFRDYAYDYGYYRFIYSADLLRSNGIRFPDYRRFQDPPFMVKALAAAGSFYALRRLAYRYRIETKPVNWRADGMIRARGLLLGLADVAAQAAALDFPKLTATVTNQSCEQYAEVLLDGEIVRGCRQEVEALCRALRVPDTAALLRSPYPGRTPLAWRKAKLFMRRNFQGAFRTCRFVSDCVRFGLPYAIGRFRGGAR